MNVKIGRNGRNGALPESRRVMRSEVRIGFSMVS